MKMILGIMLALIFLGAISLFSQTHTVDFRYAPQHYLTLIGLPADWQKTMVDEQGALGFDFGPGPYAEPLTTINFGIDGQELVTSRQFLEDPRVPIVHTERRAGNLQVLQTAFAGAPPKMTTTAPHPFNHRVRRLQSLVGTRDWAQPPEPVDPAFRNVAWGTNRGIIYRVQVPPGSRYRVAIGLCEAYKVRTGTRGMELRVEGAPHLLVDPLREGVQNRPYIFLFDARDENGDGELAIEAHPSPRFPDPNIFLNVFWLFPPDFPIDPAALMRGELSPQAEVYYPCGLEAETAAQFPRIDVLTAQFNPPTGQPMLRIKSRRQLNYDAAQGCLRSGTVPFLYFQPQPVQVTPGPPEWVVQFPVGTTRAEVFVIHGSADVARSFQPPDVQQKMMAAKAYWREQQQIPFKKIVVPDPQIQFLLATSIRNLYQVAEVVDGAFQFQPGPTVYRGLWGGDEMFQGIPAAMYGDFEHVHQMLMTNFKYQQPNGQVRVYVPWVSVSETALLVYMSCWYARLTQDKAWLQQQWDAIIRALDWVKGQRDATLAAENSPNSGLMPPGFIDGGVAEPASSYADVGWAMIALENAIRTAQWLERPQHIAAWQTLYAEFMAAYRAAANRDLRTDTQGNRYLPVQTNAPATQDFPQRGQFANLFAFRFGDFFYRADALLNSIVTGTLGMLAANYRQGLVLNLGWLRDGVWPWAGGLEGLVRVRLRQYEQAVELLYTFGNHAMPCGNWVEEQQPRDLGAQVSGDQSNSQAGAVFMHLLRMLLVFERENRLELLAGLPAAWLEPNARLELNQLPTEYGQVSLELTLDTTGRTGRLKVHSVSAPDFPSELVLFLTAFRQQGFTQIDGAAWPETMTLSWGQSFELSFKK